VNDDGYLATAATSSAALSGGKILRDNVPVDYVPESSDVVWAAILVVEVIGVLPDIESKNGLATTGPSKFSHEGVVLVGCR